MNFEKLISFLRKKKQKNYKKIALYILGEEKTADYSPLKEIILRHMSRKEAGS